MIKALERYVGSLWKNPGTHENSASDQDNPHSEHPYSWANVPSELKALFTDRIDAKAKYGFMREAIAEARKTGLVPTVGAVIVKHGNIIGRGHRKIETLRETPPLWRITHAEQTALQSVKENPEGATLYVTLEPCAGRYQGPTVEPAEVCSVIIPRVGISTVVIGLVDQDPMTRGKGLRRLHERGIRLEYGYHGLERQLLELIDDGQFDVLRPRCLAAIRKWFGAWG
jgi:pyrimidine deaminase RibD-like protein